MNEISGINLGKGSPNRLLVVLGVLLLNGGEMQQKAFASAAGVAVSSLVDLVNKSNLIPGMNIECNKGCYRIIEITPLFSKDALIELVS